MVREKISPIGKRNRSIYFYIQRDEHYEKKPVIHYRDDKCRHTIIEPTVHHYAPASPASGGNGRKRAASSRRRMGSGSLAMETVAASVRLGPRALESQTARSLGYHSLESTTRDSRSICCFAAEIFFRRTACCVAKNFKSRPPKSQRILLPPRLFQWSLGVAVWCLIIF